MIDFIIAWVDGKDPKWQSEFKKYKSLNSGDQSDARFRDWDILEYWFRGVEKFAPWVNRIHFVTQGHLPKWLNIEHEKLNIVKHSDFIPDEYLPTFNSHTIELNFHRINDLSENYVYFNDDMFLISPVESDFFFRNNLPCDQAALGILKGNGAYQHTNLENLIFIHNHYESKYSIVFKKPSNWITLKYGMFAIYNIGFLLASSFYTGFYNFHLPQPHKKSNLNKLWSLSEVDIDFSCRSKFRNYSSVNQYLQRYISLVENKFNPVNMFRRGRMFDISGGNIDAAFEFIANQKMPMICVNDNGSVLDLKSSKKMIREAFELILPDKSSFEI